MKKLDMVKRGAFALAIAGILLIAPFGAVMASAAPELDFAIEDLTESVGVGFGNNVQEQQTSPEEVAGWFEQHLHLGLADIAWGDLHNHTYYSQDAYLRALRPGAPQEVNPGTAYKAAIDKGLDFHAVTDHAEAPVISQIANGAPNVWESTKQYAAYYDAIDDNGRSVFTPFVGYEYTNPFPCVDRDPDDGIDECPGERYSVGGNESYEAYGHKNVVFRSISATPNSRVSFLDPALWTVPLTECAGNTPNNYCGFDSYTVLQTRLRLCGSACVNRVWGPKDLDNRAMWLQSSTRQVIYTTTTGMPPIRTSSVTSRSFLSGAIPRGRRAVLGIPISTWH